MTTLNFRSITSASFQHSGYAQIGASLTASQLASAQALLASLADQFLMAGGGAQALLKGGEVSAPALLPAPAGYGNQALEAGFGFMAAHAEFSFSASFTGQASFGFDLSAARLGGVSQQQSLRAEGTDKFAVHQACVSNVVGNPSNLNNSDHIALAIHDVLKQSDQKRDGKFHAMPAAELQQKLKEQYGIDSEVTKVKDQAGKEIDALKFSNGAVFADGAGDGRLDTGDYNFAGKIGEIEKKYGVKADDLVQGMKQTKARADALGYGGDLTNLHGQRMQGVAEQAKYRQELEAFSKKLEGQLGGKLDAGVAAQLYQQQQLAARYGVQLGDEQLQALARQAQLLADPMVQMLLSTLQQFDPHAGFGRDFASMFEFGYGLSLLN